MNQKEKYSELDEPRKRVIEDHKYFVSDILNESYNGASERIIKLLVLLNSGGIVTVLAYFYKTDSTHAKCLLKISLWFFLFGLLFSSLLVTLDYLICMSRLEKFNSGVGDFYDDKVSFQETPELNGKNTFPKIITIGLGFLSGASALVGVLIGVFGL